jgi:hypothetical protein
LGVFLSASVFNVHHNELTLLFRLAVKTSLPELPVELWREIIRLTGAIRGEFNPTLLYSDNRLYRQSDYIHSWKLAIHDRSTLTLVSKHFRAVALEYLYSSFLLCSYDDYVRVARIIQHPGVAPYLKRLTVNGFLGGPRDSELTFEEFHRCPNLRVYVDFHFLGNVALAWTVPPIMGPSLTVLEVNGVDTFLINRLQQMLCSLGTCASLRILRILNVSGVLLEKQPPPCILPRLELLEFRYKQIVPSYMLISEWLPSTKLPCLYTLLLGVGEPSTPALCSFGSSLTTLALCGSPKPHCPSAPLLMPQLRRFLAYHHPKKSQWSTLPNAISITGVQDFEIHLREKMYGSRGREPHHHVELSALLEILLDPKLSPSLHEVTLDVNHWTKADLWIGYQVILAVWCKKMCYQRPTICMQSVFYDIEQHTWQCVPMVSVLRDC